MGDQLIEKGAAFYKARIDASYKWVLERARATDFCASFLTSVSAGYAGFEWLRVKELSGITKKQHEALRDIIESNLRAGGLYFGCQAPENIAKVFWDHGRAEVVLLISRAVFIKSYCTIDEPYPDRAVVMHYVPEENSSCCALGGNA